MKSGHDPDLYTSLLVPVVYLSPSCYLSQEELQNRPKISTLLSTLVNYDPVQPNTMTKRSKKKKKKVSLALNFV